MYCICYQMRQSFLIHFITSLHCSNMGILTMASWACCKTSWSNQLSNPMESLTCTTTWWCWVPLIALSSNCFPWPWWHFAVLLFSVGILHNSDLDPFFFWSSGFSWAVSSYTLDDSHVFQGWPFPGDLTSAPTLPSGAASQSLSENESSSSLNPLSSHIFRPG